MWNHQRNEIIEEIIIEIIIISIGIGGYIWRRNNRKEKPKNQHYDIYGINEMTPKMKMKKWKESHIGISRKEEENTPTSRKAGKSIDNRKAASVINILWRKWKPGWRKKMIRVSAWRNREKTTKRKKNNEEKWLHVAKKWSYVWRRKSIRENHENGKQHHQRNNHNVFPS